MPRKAKHRRLPNGFGQISEIKNKNLRNPWRAMLTVGKDDFKRPITRILGYYETYNDAYTALINYHKNPYDIDGERMSLEDLYEKWSGPYFDSLTSNSSQRTITAAWAYVNIKNMNIKDIRISHLKGCINDASIIDKKTEQKKLASAGTKSRMKSLFNLLFDYAVENELVEKNYARMFNLDKEIVAKKQEVELERHPFTPAEMKLLWDNVDKVKFCDMILIGCYSGWRPQELAILQIKNVDLENKIMSGGIKSDAGKNRIVPIHPIIFDLVKRNYDFAQELNSKYLFNDPESQRGINLTYDKYRHRFTKVMDRLKMELEHHPHDTRHHFVTIAKKANIDEYALKLIVGHSVNDITEKVYTHRETSWLIEEMNKVK